MPTKRSMYLSDLNRLLKDERLSPNGRRLLAVLKMWINMDPGPDRELLSRVIDAQFGAPQRIRWTDSEDDQAVKLPQTNLDKEATAKIRNLFDEALRERQIDEGIHSASPGGS